MAAEYRESPMLGSCGRGHHPYMQTQAAARPGVSGSVLCLVGSGTPADERSFAFAEWLANATGAPLAARPVPRRSAAKWRAGADEAAFIVTAGRPSRLASLGRPERSPETATKLGTPVVLVPDPGETAAPAAGAGELVCGVDQSRSARSAVRTTAALALRLGLPMSLVHVQEHLWPFAITPIAGAPAPPVRAFSEGREAGWGLLDDLDEMSPGRARLRLRSGMPARSLEEHAAHQDAPLIVVGAPDHGPLASLVVLSTAWELVRHAGRPVMYVPAGFEPSW